MKLKLEEALARVPQFAGAKEIKTVRLGGGITNENIRIIADEESFVLRLSGENTELLGINREHEYAAARAAGFIGIAPEVVHFIRPEGCLVTRFIEGGPLSPEAMRHEKNIRRIAATLRRIHTMGPIPGSFSAFRTVETYAQIARQHGVTLPGEFNSFVGRMKEIEAALSRHSQPLCPCHNDLLNRNFLDDGDIRVLDWEYSGMGDIFFDLANLCVNNDFKDGDEQRLLDAYFGDLTPGRWSRLKLMKIISDFREAMWGVVQSGISTIDFDFSGYAAQHFARMKKNLDDLRYGQYLKGAAEDA